MIVQKDFTMELFPLLIATDFGTQLFALFPTYDVCTIAAELLSSTDNAPEMGCNPEPFTVFTPDQVASLIK